MEYVDERIYTNYILANMPRIFTQIDRDQDSKTYGCCDRNHWHLKIRDFSSAILQQTCLTLTLLYKINFKGNIYFQNENVRKWAVAALRYMGEIQLHDGSFNEYYPNEHGFPPTAFNLFAGCRACLELNLSDEKIFAALEKSARYLSSHFETNAYNQEIASIAGLALWGKISEDSSCKKAIDKKIEKILKSYCDEGWFPEQGGADIGYSSVALDMLAEYYSASKDERIKPCIDGMVNFLSHFVHPDGSIGGEYGSRNTIYFMPNGLELYISLGFDGNNIAKAMLQMLYLQDNKSDHYNFMDAVDERYLSHYVMHSYLRALQRFESRKAVAINLPFNTRHVARFSRAGIMTMYNGKYYAIAAPKKGGLIKVYRGGTEVFLDCGYRIPLKKGKTAATNWISDEHNIIYGKNSVKVESAFFVVKQKVQNPVYHFMLRIAALFLGANVNCLIKKMTIFQNKAMNVSFERKITFCDSEICIEDEIRNPDMYSVFEAPNISLRLVASGNFFSRSDLLKTALKNYGEKPRLHIAKKFSVADGRMEETLYDD